MIEPEIVVQKIVISASVGELRTSHLGPLEIVYVTGSNL